MAADLADKPADPSIVGEGLLGDGGARLESARGFRLGFSAECLLASLSVCPSVSLDLCHLAAF